MATIADVITDRLAGFSITLTAVRLDAALVEADLDGSVDYSRGNQLAVKGVLAGVMSDLLAMPDVTEGGYAVKWDRSAVQACVRQLREEITPPVSTVPVVRDKSFLW